MEGSDRTWCNTRALHILCTLGNYHSHANQRVTQVEDMDTIFYIHRSSYYELCRLKIRRGWYGCFEVSIIPFTLEWF